MFDNNLLQALQELGFLEVEAGFVPPDSLLNSLPRVSLMWVDLSSFMVDTPEGRRTEVTETATGRAWVVRRKVTDEELDQLVALGVTDTSDSMMQGALTLLPSQGSA